MKTNNKAEYGATYDAKTDDNNSKIDKKTRKKEIVSRKRKRKMRN